MIVVDASVLGPALVDDGDDGVEARARLSDERLLAPDLIDLEVVSLVRSILRAGGIDQRRAEGALDDLQALPLQRVSTVRLVRRVWELRDNLSPYDASYVALAEAMQVLLVTADRRLAKAPGTRCGIEVLRAGGRGG